MFGSCLITLEVDQEFGVVSVAPKGWLWLLCSVGLKRGKGW